MTPPLRLILTGMHRSGTSLVASLFAAWNVRMGGQLPPAGCGNPAGYFEDVDFLELNRRILLACTPPEDGHRDWGWTESDTFDAGQLPAHRNAAAALVAARDSAGGPWGWKDPRTSMLLDFWDDVLGSDARFLLLYRHPWEVADSMLRTGAEVWLTHPSYPARIWTRYNRRILDFHRRHRDRTLLVSTNRLLRDPETFAAAVRGRFGIEASAGTLASLRTEGLFASLPDDDPLPRLWRYANAEAMEVLAALDDAADVSNDCRSTDRRWEAATCPSTPQRFSSPRDRAILAAMRTLRRESRSETASHAAMLQQQSAAQERIGTETAGMREELPELAADVRALYERVGATASFTRPQTRAKVRPDGDRDPHREDKQPTDRERQDG